ncbi:MAG: DUF1311 domain-containing protein [Clostridium sp.]|nr:DUF1311 domain-containing protein [Clostridium sp.]
MKDKRIWIVIGCILVIGSGVTYYTNSYVRSQAGSDQIMAQAGADLWASAGSRVSGGISPMEGAPATAAGGAEGRGVPEAETAAAGEAKLAEETEEAAVYSGPGSVPQEVSGASGTDEAGAFVQERAGEPAAALVLEDGPGASAAAVPEGAPEETEAVPISPLTGARVREEKAALVSDYRQRLEDLDNQIQKMREEDAAESASNVYSIKTSAETELKLWEGEMGTIYNGLLELLSQEDAAALAAEQQEWLKNRDLKAAEGTVRNSSVESLGYAATLVSLTRDRAYELAGRYEEAAGILSESGADKVIQTAP